MRRQGRPCAQTQRALPFARRSLPSWRPAAPFSLRRERRSPRLSPRDARTPSLRLADRRSPIAPSHPSVCCRSLRIPWTLDVGELRGGLPDFVLDLFSLSLPRRAACGPPPIDVLTSESFFRGPALYTQPPWASAASASVELISPSSKPFFSQCNSSQ